MTLCGALQTLKAEQMKYDEKLTVTTFAFGESIAVGSGKITINYSGMLNDKVHTRLMNMFVGIMFRMLCMCVSSVSIHACILILNHNTHLSSVVTDGWVLP